MRQRTKVKVDLYYPFKHGTIRFRVGGLTNVNKIRSLRLQILVADSSANYGRDSTDCSIVCVFIQLVRVWQR